eukprot:CAMPEP_0115859908 /NCGR_PEP_ID=MMETSP0287-20121206/16856_1 /TAXON_ID=412157 /ORGANISM="Chrysochromulina rotalis, Strain UIO044" /LENGTH=410 /DNA_ID=CAMNT_0003314219 /DNA_START=6 /DNA_END=1238 /DNA_ORIENTATION=+
MRALLRVSLLLLASTRAAAVAPSLNYEITPALYYDKPDNQPVKPEMCNILAGSNQTDYTSTFCKNGKCWPALWLLGAQKAATSAIYSVLEECGLVVGAWPSKEATGASVPPFCTQPCKETHFFLDYRFATSSSGFVVAANADRATQFTSMYSSGDGCSDRTYEFMPERAHAACGKGHFIEASPSTDDPGMPLLLANDMPKRLLIKARFVLILREPVERALSWYNHNRCPAEKQYGAPWTPCASSEKSKSFDEYIACCQHSKGQGLAGHDGHDAGDYADFIDSLLDRTPVTRDQLLVLNYGNAFANATVVQQTMRAITTHYGLPILDRVTEVPPSNSKNYAEKVEQITCAARQKLHDIYEPVVQRLYSRFDEDYKLGRAPKHEPPFGRFALTVKCGNAEQTAAAMHPGEHS